MDAAWEAIRSTFYGGLELSATAKWELSWPSINHGRLMR